MKYFFCALLFGAVSTMAHADPVHGVWKTEADDAGAYLRVQVADCGSEICGTIYEAVSPNGEVVDTIDGYEHIGKKMVWDMQPKGDGVYNGGKIWAPDRDKTYNSKMTLSGDDLIVKGCVFGVCQGQTWKRAG